MREFGLFLAVIGLFGCLLVGIYIIHVFNCFKRDENEKNFRKPKRSLIFAMIISMGVCSAHFLLLIPPTLFMLKGIDLATAFRLPFQGDKYAMVLVANAMCDIISIIAIGAYTVAAYFTNSKAGMEERHDTTIY